MSEVITVEPKAFDDVPIIALVKFLSKYDLELAFQPDKSLIIRRMQHKPLNVQKGTK